MDVSWGVWHGQYGGYTADWIRAWDRHGRLLPTSAESGEEARQQAAAERARAEAEKQRAEAEKRRAEKLAARLRELGVDPDAV